MTGTKVQLYNGLLLIFTFFSCRLVYGTYQSVRVFGDVWAAVDTSPMLNTTISTADPVEINTMEFATETSTVPLWLAASYLASNLTLNSLNLYWFVMMIAAVRKRFVPAKAPAHSMESKKTPAVEDQAATVASGRQQTSVMARSRKA
jgi:hypothetical protein